MKLGLGVCLGFPNSLRKACVLAESGLVLRGVPENAGVSRHSRKIYTMMPFGMLGFSHTWYEPKAC